ncbi:hypothetical protein D3C78_1059940 [compost metagenome]
MADPSGTLNFGRNALRYCYCRHIFIFNLLQNGIRILLVLHNSDHFAVYPQLNAFGVTRKHAVYLIQSLLRIDLGLKFLVLNSSDTFRMYYHFYIRILLSIFLFFLCVQILKVGLIRNAAYLLIAYKHSIIGNRICINIMTPG